MNLSQFAESRGVKSNAVSNYLARHPEIKKYTTKNGKELELTEKAVKLLDEVYPMPKPVQIINGVDPEEHQELLKQFAKAQATIASLQEEKAKAATLIAQAEAQKALLEDRTAQLDEAKKAKEEAETEINRLRSRSLWQRIRNK